jgi:hypothetical protein
MALTKPPPRHFNFTNQRDVVNFGLLEQVLKTLQQSAKSLSGTLLLTSCIRQTFEFWNSYLYFLLASKSAIMGWGRYISILKKRSSFREGYHWCWNWYFKQIIGFDCPRYRWRNLFPSVVKKVVVEQREVGIHLNYTKRKQWGGGAFKVCGRCRIFILMQYLSLSRYSEAEQHLDYSYCFCY